MVIFLYRILIADMTHLGMRMSSTMYILCFPALTLKGAINALHSVCDRWYTIGVQLEVPTFELRNIAKKSGHSLDQLCDTLDYWMNKVSSPTWRHLVDALKAPSVGENRLAEKIEEKCCSPVEQSGCDESETAQCHQGMYVCMYVRMFVGLYASMCAVVRPAVQIIGF